MARSSRFPRSCTLIATAIEHDPPATLAEGGVIRKGYNQPLDELRALTTNGKQWIAELQAKERERTGISSLKVGFNNVFGYYIEITNTHKERVPQDYIRKQTLTECRALYHACTEGIRREDPPCGGTHPRAGDRTLHGGPPQGLCRGRCDPGECHGGGASGLLHFAGRCRRKSVAMCVRK